MFALFHTNNVYVPEKAIDAPHKKEDQRAIVAVSQLFEKLSNWNNAENFNAVTSLECFSILQFL